MNKDEKIKSKGKIPDKINQSERIKDAKLHRGKVRYPQHDIRIPPWEDPFLEALNRIFAKGIKIVMQIAE